MKNKNTILIIATAIISGILIIVCSLLLTQNRTLAKENEQWQVQSHYNNVLATPPLPEKVDFMGEAVPLDNYMIREALDRELTTVCYQHSSTLLALKRSGRWFPIIEKILKEEGLPEDFKYLCIAESNMSNAISPAKAVGFWQFLQSTATLYGLEVNEEVDERYHVEKATHAACRYLKDSKKKLGSWALAAAAYNCGEARVTKSLSAQSTDNYWDTYFNPETARYVFRILAYKILFENPHIYGVKINNEDKYAPIDTEQIEVTSSIPDLYKFCQDHDITYKELKLWNPWLRSSKLTVKSKTYSIKIIKKQK